MSRLLLKRGYETPNKVFFVQRIFNMKTEPFEGMTIRFGENGIAHLDYLTYNIDEDMWVSEKSICGLDFNKREPDFENNGWEIVSVTKQVCSTGGCEVTVHMNEIPY